MLERFGREGLEFKGVMVMLRLGSLLEKMNTNFEAIKAGKDTINNMLASDRVQGTTNDWTLDYNVLLCITVIAMLMVLLANLFLEFLYPARPSLCRVI